MAEPRETDLTGMLAAFAAGDAAAGEAVFVEVTRELHRVAESLLPAHGAGHTLQPTALVNEAYLRLFGGRAPAQFANRDHFLAFAARAMRSVVVDHARRRRARKRGGESERLELEGVAQLLEARAPDLVALNEALARLEAVDAELARMVELRFFAGLSVEDTARVLSVSEATVVRGWRFARLWLERELGDG